MNRSIMLIVDDIKANRAVLASSFSDQFTIATAANGLEAQEYVAEHCADIAIVLLDIIMPQMDGIAFLKWISVGEYSNIPVIAVTAEPSYQIEALKNGAWDFVVKPFEQNVLQARVNNVLGRYGFLREKEIIAGLEATNAKLEKAKLQMDHLVNSIPGGIAIYRMTDRFETLYFSDGVAELSGDTREEYRQRVGEDATDLVYPPDKRRLMAAVMDSLQNGESIDEVCRIYHRNGELVWVRFHGLPMERTPAGMIVYVVFQGVSPQTKLYQSVLDKTQTAVYACDVETYDILYFNQKMADFAGVEPASVPGKKCYNYFFHRDSPCTFCHMKEMQPHTMLEREFTYPKNQRTYQLKGTLLDWNKITAHVEYIEDITERKAAEAKTAGLFQQLGSLMEHVPGALCLYKATAAGLEPVIHNKAFYEMFGYSQENIASVNRKTSFLNVHPDDLAEFKQKTLEAIRTSSPLSYTYRCYNDRKGEYIWLYMRSVVLDQPGGVKLCYVSYTDVTEERSKQEQLLKAQNSIKLLQKQAEDALMEYKTLVNTVPGAIVLYEVDGDKIRTKYYSDGICTLSGYTREERDVWGDQDAVELVYSEDIPRVRTALRHALETNSNLDLTYRIKTKSGNPRYVHLNATPVRGVDGKVELHAVFSDMEEVKRLEKAANEQRLRYEVAAKSAGINILEYDIQTDSLTIFSNSSRIKESYYTIQDYISYTVEHNHVREDSLQAFYSIFERLRNGEKEVAEDIWYKTTDEADWWCERMIYTTAFDSTGKPIKAFGAGRDITREKEAVRKFQEEMHYRTAMQGSNLGSIKINLTQNVILGGESPFALVKEWMKSGDADSYFKANAACIPAGERRESYCATFNRKALIEYFNGGEYSLSMKVTRTIDEHFIGWLQYNVHLMKNPENKDVIAFIIARDITDEQVMKTVMETVTRTDYEFFIVVDGSIDSATDFSADRKGNFFTSDQSYEKRSEELIREVVCDEDLDRVIANCKIDHVFEQIKNGEIYKFNYSAREENGEIRRKQLQFTLIHRERKTFLLTRIDVHEIFAEQEQAQKKMKEALRAAQSAAKAKTDFLSRMSHDIRTPLNAVIGLSGLGATSDSVEEMRDYYKQIESSGKYLLSIINDVLDMSKIEGRTLVLRPTVVFIPDFIRDTIAIVLPMAESKNIRFEVKQQGITSHYLYVDATYLKQVVVNLLSNAVKFTPPGGLIELCLENISRTEHSVRNRMTVRDNGIGISKKFLPKVFLPFEQENTNDDMSRKGSGLGLSIVKSIIDLMGGSIQVESEQGKGTAFLIEWDFEIATEQDIPVKNTAVFANSTPLEGHHILLCEDHPLNTKIATKLLEKQGMLVTHAENGQRAVDLFQQSEPDYFDAILMDIRMPVMDGLEAAKRIRNLRRADAKTVPVIAMTANAFAEDMQQSLDAGMNAHLAKPIEPHMLYETLAELMKTTERAE